MSRPKVALLIESSRAYGRGLLRGVGAYMRTHRPWSIYVEPHGLNEPLPRWIRTWKGDGILARITDERTARLLRAIKVPTIDLRGAVADSGIPLVGLDSRAAARLAFEHLRERGFRHFAFCGVISNQYRFLDQRADEFERVSLESGCQFSKFPGTGKERNAQSWDGDQRQLKRWLNELPKPVGILACHDDRGVELLNACREARIAVPEDVAVTGIDNDVVLCELSDPPLSSVDSNTEQIGYRAAELLDALMAGRIELNGTTLVEPAGIVLRRSTDTIAVSDREAAAVMRFIREHATNGINVVDVLSHTALSRSTLERRFRKVFGLSPSDEIQRVRLERVKQLLAETEHSMSKIADMCGYEYPEHMATVFRREIGQTPGVYRRMERQAKPAVPYASQCSAKFSSSSG
jgi:LacI family transcriptional regulator